MRYSIFQCLRPVVHELRVDAQILLPEKPDPGLQFVPISSEDPNLVLLNLCLDFELSSLNQLHDLSSLLRRDTLLQLDPLTDSSACSRLHLAAGQGLERYLPLYQLPLQDTQHLLQLEFILGGEQQGMFLAGDARRAALKVEALPDLAHGLMDGVI